MTTTSPPTDYPTKRAVIYLRVSTAGQVNTDRDGEGFSIPAQREACHRKATMLDAQVVDEYLDAGESARSADRPKLQTMLDRLTTEHDIDYVIVHKVDRLARNRADDVTINVAIRAAGAQLVSVTENIDESPSGMLMHGIMASLSEFYSQNLASEIKKGMGQKVKKGGYPHKAPIGYLNLREVHRGNEIRIIGVDPDRGSHVEWAFDAYASGNYSLGQLTEALEDRGLVTRPTPKFPAKPLVVRHVNNMLRNPFYVGLMTWQGAQHPGTHEPLVSIETFANVQAILDSRNQSSERMRARPHYLKGTIFCGRCGERLSFSRSRGNGGEYDYFYCRGRHSGRKECDLPFMAVEKVEEAVAAHYGTVELSPTTLERLRTDLLAAMKERTSGSVKEAERQRKRITKLEHKRRQLLQAHLAGAIPVELLKEEQDRVTRQIADAGAALAATEVDWDNVEQTLNAALALASRFEEAYRQARPATKRLLNQAVFENLQVDTDRVTYTRLAAPFAQLLAEDLLIALDQEDPYSRPGRIDSGHGVSKGLLVELRGIEPLTSSMPWKRSTN
jgi:site-specific DNA recombinase